MRATRILVGDVRKRYHPTATLAHGSLDRLLVHITPETVETVTDDLAYGETRGDDE